MSETLSMHPVLGREVPVGSIDKELHRLWAEDDARTNASLVNLAVYSEEPGSLERNSEVIRELTVEHACRAILIDIDRAAPGTSLRAWITAHCHLAHGHKSVCCEQLAFELKGRATGRLRNTVFAHLNSDLPLILWWQGELTPNFEERLYSLVDRFVFDSAEWQDPAASFARMSEMVESSKRLVIQDLSWTRSFHFRVSIAALFDDPVAQRALPSIEAVEIVHHPDHRGAALLLLAWLAVQAKWRDGLELDLADARRDDGVEGFSFEHASGAAVRATLRADADSPALGVLRLQAREVTVEVLREAECCRLLRRLEAPGHTTESHAPSDPDRSAALIGEQLSRGGKNSLYRKILPRFLQLLNR